MKLKRLKILIAIFLGIGILTCGGRITWADQKISLDFRDADLRTVVLPSISQMTGLNIVLAPDVEGKVTARFKNLPVMDIISVILEANDCQYKRVDNFIKVTKIFPSAQAFSLKYALVGEVAISLSLFLSSRGHLIINEEANSITISDRKENLKKIKEFISSEDTIEKQLKDESIALKYIRAEDVLPLIKEKISKDASIKVFSSTNTLLITDTSYNLSKITPLILSLDVFKPEEKIFTLKFALVKEILPSISSYLSKEGKIKIKEETNKIIISDIPYNLKKVFSFISSEDIPEKWIKKESFFIKYLPLEEVLEEVNAKIESSYGKIKLNKEESILEVSDTSFNLSKINNLIKQTDVFKPEEKVYSLRFASLLEISEEAKSYLSDKGEITLNKENSSFKVVDVEKNIKKISLLVKEMDVLKKQLIMPLSFKDKPLKDVLNILSERTGVSIISEEGIEKKVTATFSRPTPLLKVLNYLLSPDYFYEIQDSFILVSSFPLKKESFSLSYAKVLDLSSSLSLFLSSRGHLIINKEANSITVSDRKENLKKIKEFISSEDTFKKQLKDKSITLKYIRAEEILPLIKEKISKDTNIKVFSSTNTLLITDTSYNLSKITPLILSLDVFKPEEKIFTLKFALVKEILPSISSCLSEEGKTKIEEETNQVVISDIPYNLKKVFSFISSEDIPEKWMKKESFFIKYLPLEEVLEEVNTKIETSYRKIKLNKEKSILEVSDTSFNLAKIISLIKEMDIFKPEEKVYSLRFAPLSEVTEEAKSYLSDKGEITLNKENSSFKVVDVEKNIKKIDNLVKEVDVLKKQLVTKKYFLKYLTGEEAKFFLGNVITQYGEVSFSQSKSNPEEKKLEEYIVIPSEKSNNLEMNSSKKNKVEIEKVNFIYITDLKKNISEIEKAIEGVNNPSQAREIVARTFYIEKGSLEQIAIAIANLIGAKPEDIQGINIKEGEWMRTTFQGGGPKIGIKGVGE